MAAEYPSRLFHDLAHMFIEYGMQTRVDHIVRREVVMPTPGDVDWVVYLRGPMPSPAWLDERLQSMGHNALWITFEASV